MTEAARRKLIKNCDKQLIDCFCECCKNVLKGNVELNSRQLKRLRREKNNLRALALKKTSLKKKRKILQKGGFLGALIPPVLSVLGSLFGGLISDGAR
jgi:lipoate synthase